MPCYGLEWYQDGQQDLLTIVISRLEMLEQPFVWRLRKAFGISYHSHTNLRFSLFIFEDDEVNSLLKK